MKYLIMIDGQILNQVVTDNIIAAAKRGKITKSGKKLLLVPDTRYGPKDCFGLQAMKRVQKRDCIRLKSLCPGV